MLELLFVLFMLIGVPVAVSMAAASLAYILISGDVPPFVVDEWQPRRPGRGCRSGIRP